MNRFVRPLGVIVAVVGVASAAGQETEWKIHLGNELVSPVVRGAVDDDGETVWLATYGALYRVDEAVKRGCARVIRGIDARGSIRLGRSPLPAGLLTQVCMLCYMDIQDPIAALQPRTRTATRSTESSLEGEL